MDAIRYHGYDLIPAGAGWRIARDATVVWPTVPDLDTAKQLIRMYDAARKARKDECAAGMRCFGEVPGKPQKCSALAVKQCDGCGFYKSVIRHIADQARADARLDKLTRT